MHVYAKRFGAKFLIGSLFDEFLVLLKNIRRRSDFRYINRHSDRIQGLQKIVSLIDNKFMIKNYFSRQQQLN